MSSESSADVSEHPESQVPRPVVIRQLNKLVADDLFKRSNRYPAFLRYIVERTLDGLQEDLKERTIGVEVFGRQPDYDTATDPIVRNTASEVRKRIAQYYGVKEHQEETVIVLPVGSYIPQFRESITVDSPPALEAAAVVEEAPKKRFNSRLAAIALAIATGLALLATFYFRQPTPLDRFWSPLLNTGAPVLICVAPASRNAKALSPGEKSAATTIMDIHTAGSEAISIFDAKTAARITGLLETKSVTAAIQPDFRTSLDDLRRGPVVIIGGLNNTWTTRLLHGHRFTFKQDGSVGWIEDRENPSSRTWSLDFSAPYSDLRHDYAIVSRVWDTATGRPLLALAGIAKYGSGAAGEFVTNQETLRDLNTIAPKGWERENMQIVLEVAIVDGNLSKPHILATHFWDVTP